MIGAHLRGGDFHVPLKVVLPALTVCEIEVIDPALLHARCPAEGLHTTPTRLGHCIIFPNAGTLCPSERGKLGC